MYSEVWYMKGTLISLSLGYDRDIKVEQCSACAKPFHTVCQGRVLEVEREEPADVPPPVCRSCEVKDQVLSPVLLPAFVLAQQKEELEVRIRSNLVRQQQQKVEVEVKARAAEEMEEKKKLDMGPWRRSCRMP